MTCCNHDCNEGRACPVRIAGADKRPFRPIAYVIGYLDVYLRWWDHKAAKYAGHLTAITPREPIDWLLWLENAVAVVFLGLVAGGVLWSAYQALAFLGWPLFVAALSL